MTSPEQVAADQVEAYGTSRRLVNLYHKIMNDGSEQAVDETNAILTGLDPDRAVNVITILLTLLYRDLVNLSEMTGKDLDWVLDRIAGDFAQTEFEATVAGLVDSGEFGATS